MRVILRYNTRKDLCNPTGFSFHHFASVRVPRKIIRNSKITHIHSAFHVILIELNIQNASTGTRLHKHGGWKKSTKYFSLISYQYARALKYGNLSRLVEASGSMARIFFLHKCTRFLHN